MHEPATSSRSVPAVRSRPEGAPTAVPESERRVVELDGVRGLACLAILFHHFKPHAFPMGWAAVDLFFVLSGYLITGIILKHLDRDRFLANFYMRRGLRIWPIYYLTVAGVALAGPWLFQRPDYAGLPYVAAYLQDIGRYWGSVSPTFSVYTSHTWSLAVEEQFYLLWPAVICLVGRRGAIPAAVLLASTSFALRSAGLHWRLLGARADGLALGALLAAALVGGGAASRKVATRRALTAAGAAGAAYLIVLGLLGGLSRMEAPRWPGPTVFAVELVSVAAVGLVVLNQGSPWLRVLRRPRLVHIGQLSYGLYLYHYALMVLSDDLARALGMGGRPFWREALTLAVIYAVAALSWRYVESPLLRLKDRFEYASKAANAVKGPHRPA